ncbi:MAG TPA: hypothetical protein VF013_01790, partial [Candidatus Limnocylindria bacterium]
MRAVWASAFLLRRIRAELGVATIIFVLVGATAFLFAAAPRLFNAAADCGLRSELAGGQARDRNVQLSLISDLPDRDPVAHAQGVADQLLEAFPASLRSLIDGRSLVITSIRFAIEDAPRYSTSYLSFRYQDGLTDAIQLVEGRMPESTGEAFPPAVFGFPGQGEPPDTVPHLEVALSDRSAEELGVKLGDVLTVDASSQDPLLTRFRALAQPLRATVEVVGIFTITRPDADAFFNDTSLHFLSFASLNPDNPIALATALVAPTAMPELVASGLPFRYDGRFLVNPQRLDTSGLDALLADLERMNA